MLEHSLLKWVLKFPGYKAACKFFFAFIIHSFTIIIVIVIIIIIIISIYKLGDFGITSNLIGSLSLMDIVHLPGGG